MLEKTKQEWRDRIRILRGDLSLTFQVSSTSTVAGFPLHCTTWCKEKPWNSTGGSAAAPQSAQHPSRYALTISFSMPELKVRVPSAGIGAVSSNYYSVNFSKALYLNVPGHFMDVKG